MKTERALVILMFFSIFIGAGISYSVIKLEGPRGVIVDTVNQNGTERLAVDIYQTDTGAGLLVTSFAHEVAEGDVLGYSGLNKFGSNPSVSTGQETIWDGGGLYVWATGAELVNIVSDDVDDTSAGTGARTIELQGLDSSYLEISETVIFNGTTNVLSSNSYLRLHRMIVKSAGTTGSNEGDLSATQQTSGIVMAKILVGNNQTLMAVYTVPEGIDLTISHYYVSADKDKTIDINLLIRAFGEVFAVKHTKQITGSGAIQLFNPHLFVAEKSDIEIVGVTTTGVSKASAGFDGYLEVE